MKSGFNGQKAYGQAQKVYKLARKKKHFIFHLLINRLLKYAASVLRQKKINSSDGKKYETNVVENSLSYSDFIKIKNYCNSNLNYFQQYLSHSFSHPTN